MSRLYPLFAFAFVWLSSLQAQQTTQVAALIPAPQEMTVLDDSWLLEAVDLELPPLEDEAARRAVLEELVHTIFPAADSSQPAARKLRLQLDSVEAPSQPKEAYRLRIGDDVDGILLQANTSLGLLHGLRTLEQLSHSTNGAGERVLPQVDIHDWPAFEVRGFMLDVGRNFIEFENLTPYLETLAAYKYNVFHWHLSDYFGWRLESKIYPELQSDEATLRDKGGFYTQEQFQQVVAWCHARGITVIPEFDSPGHTTAFRRALGVKDMSDPRAIEAMEELIAEVCSLAPAEIMPWIHLGTDEAHQPEEKTGPHYLERLHAAVSAEGRTAIGWQQGLWLPNDTNSIQQTWGPYSPRAGVRHIDSRVNYVNHFDPLDAARRLFFQQPGRGSADPELNLGGILCYWPDINIDDDIAEMRISPVFPSIVAYSETIWRGLEEDHHEYWARIPAPDTPEFKAYDEFEARLAAHRDRYFTDIPFPFVRSAHTPWKLLGPVAAGELPLNEIPAQDVYHENDEVYRWTDERRGATLHIRHFFDFPGELNSFPEGKDVVWARSFIHSDRDREIDAWIGFNTPSTSDRRAGAAVEGQWNPAAECALWINREAIAPPQWAHPGRTDEELAFTDEIYSNRPPNRIQLREGWNEVLIRTAPSFKWCFTFTPIDWDGINAHELQDLRWSTEIKDRK